MFPSTFQTANVGKASQTRIARFRMLIERCRRRRRALKVLRERLDRISDLPANWKLLGLGVTVHAVPLTPVGAADAREVAILVLIAFFNIPEALRERVLRALPWDSKKR